MKKIIKVKKEAIKKRKRPEVIVLTGPSGVGKSTLISRILKDRSINKKLMFSISHTTRERRRGEKEGRDYYFVSKQEFIKMMKRGEFLEWAKVHNNLYGTHIRNLKDAKKKNKVLILDIDVQGAKKLRRKLGKSKTLLIFIKPPSINELRKRLLKRGDTKASDIKIRLKNARKEIKEIKKFDVIITNDKITKALTELKKIIKDALALK